MKKRLSAIILMLAVFTSGAFAANAYQKSITVNYDVNLEINGRVPQLTDVNGKAVKPFTYDGTTYVPIRAVAEEMGAYVGYDSASGTAIVFQDDVEAMYTAYSIGEARRKLQWAVENTLQCCELYNTNDMSRSDFMSTVKSIADDATVAANDAKEKYGSAVDNQNIYIEDIDLCMSELTSELNTANSFFEYAGNFANSKSSSDLAKLFSARNEIVINEKAVKAVDSFMQTMW